MLNSDSEGAADDLFGLDPDREYNNQKEPVQPAQSPEAISNALKEEAKAAASAQSSEEDDIF